MPEHRSLLAVVAEAAGLGNSDRPDQPTSREATAETQAVAASSTVVDTGQRFSMVTGSSKPASGADRVEQLRAKGVTVSAAEAATLEELAAKWNGSADIRAEFRTYEAFSGYMLAKAAGRAKIFGQS